MGELPIHRIKDLILALSEFINLKGLEVTSPSKILAQTLIDRSSILLNDIPKLFGAGASVPLPLIGFTYMPMDRVELLNYSYSQYPFLNRESITNTYIKNPTRFQLLAVKPITRLNTFFFNFATNIALKKFLEKYINAGGTFLVITPWEVITDCVVEKLEGVKFNDTSLGEGFLFSFYKPNIYEDTTGSQSNFLKALTNGGIPS